MREGVAPRDLAIDQIQDGLCRQGMELGLPDRLSDDMTPAVTGD